MGLMEMLDTNNAVGNWNVSLHLPFFDKYPSGFSL